MSGQPGALLRPGRFRNLPGENEEETEETLPSILGLFHSMLLKINMALFFFLALVDDTLTPEIHMRHSGAISWLPVPKKERA